MTAGSPSPGENRVPATTDLPSFVAWLAVRVEDEATRRSCRRVAEAYEEWLWADGGPAATRRSRFVPTATRRLQLTRTDVEQALDRLYEHRAVVARTLPVDR